MGSSTQHSHLVVVSNFSQNNDDIPNPKAPNSQYEWFFYRIIAMKNGLKSRVVGSSTQHSHLVVVVECRHQF